MCSHRGVALMVWGYLLKMLDEAHCGVRPQFAAKTAARRASEGSQMFSDELTSHNTDRNVSKVHAGSCELIWRKR